MAEEGKHALADNAAANFAEKERCRARLAICRFARPFFRVDLILATLALPSLF